MWRLQAWHAATMYRGSSPVMARPRVWWAWPRCGPDRWAWIVQVCSLVLLDLAHHPSVWARQRYPSRLRMNARSSRHSRELPFAHDPLTT